MKRSLLSAHIGLVMVGLIATVALLLEIRLPVTQDVHFLLQLLWVGVAMGSLFVVMLQPAINSKSQNDFESDDIEAGFNRDDLPEWYDPDRLWMQHHPDEPRLANDIDREEV